MDLQKAAWGQIEWMQTDNGALTAQSMSVGIATIFPHARQKSHIHYESEQFIYIMQGYGIDMINGNASKFEEGMFYYIPANVTHQIINTSDIPIKHLVVTVYTSKRKQVPYELPEIENYRESLCTAVDAIHSQLIGPHSPPITIFDDMGNLILQTGNYPVYCLERCRTNREPEKIRCICHDSFFCDGEFLERTADCPYGLTVSQTPIRYGEHFLGCIFSGHLFLGTQQTSRAIDMYETSTGTLLAIQAWVANVVESIISFCSFNGIRQKLQLRESIIKQTQQNEKTLEDNLKAMQNTVTNLRINHHFLFNTLNAIAGQALLGDESATYQAITDLAKMFRYSTSENLKNVPLREEISYLRTYLHMQQLRYGDLLTANISCQKNILARLVPFNFLQPFVENAFTHGFVDMVSQMVLNIFIKCQGDSMIFTISNNGALIDGTTVKRVLGGMRNNSGHGLSLVYAKLQNTYGGNFSIDMASNPEDGTSVIITLPLMSNEVQRGIDG